MALKTNLIKISILTSLLTCCSVSNSTSPYIAFENSSSVAFQETASGFISDSSISSSIDDNTSSETVPLSYFFSDDYLSEQTAIIDSFSNDSINYLFITDLHVDTENELEYCTNVLNFAINLANNNNNIDFVCIGGDLTTLCFDSKQDYLSYIAKILAPLSKCQKPVLILSGNHDDNTSKATTDETLRITYRDWRANVLDAFSGGNNIYDSNNSFSRYYYLDIAKDTVKYRIFCLDSSDHNEHSSNSLYWGFSDYQIDWLENETSISDEQTDFILLSHMSINKEYNVENRDVDNYEQLCNYVFNYNSTHASSFLINSFGHTHLDYAGSDQFLKYTCTATTLLGGYLVSMVSLFMACLITKLFLG